MLVLTRKVGESILIDGGITITISGIKGSQVRVGISAPPDVAVNREEVARRIQEWADPTHADGGQRDEVLV